MFQEDELQDDLHLIKSEEVSTVGVLHRLLQGMTSRAGRTLNGSSYDAEQFSRIDTDGDGLIDQGICLLALHVIVS